MFALPFSFFFILLIHLIKTSSINDEESDSKSSFPSSLSLPPSYSIIQTTPPLNHSSVVIDAKEVVSESEEEEKQKASDNDDFDDYDDYDNEAILNPPDRPRSPATPVPQRLLSQVDDDSDVSSLDSSDFYHDDTENIPPPLALPATSLASTFRYSDARPDSSDEPLTYNALTQNFIKKYYKNGNFSTALFHLTKGNPLRSSSTSIFLYDEMILHCHIELGSSIKNMFNWYKIVESNILTEQERTSENQVTSSFLLSKSKLLFLHLPISGSLEDVDSDLVEFVIDIRPFLNVPFYQITDPEPMDPSYILLAYSSFLKSIYLAILREDKDFDFLSLIPYMESIRSRVRVLLWEKTFEDEPFKSKVKEIKDIESMMPRLILNDIHCPIIKLHAILLWILPCCDEIDSNGPSTTFLDPLLNEEFKRENIFNYFNDIYLHFLFIYHHINHRFNHSSLSLKESDSMIERLKGLVFVPQIRKKAFELILDIFIPILDIRLYDALELCECLLASMEFSHEEVLLSKINEILEECKGKLVWSESMVIRSLERKIFLLNDEMHELENAALVTEEYAKCFMLQIPHSKGRLGLIDKGGVQCSPKMIFQILKFAYPLLNKENNLLQHSLLLGDERIIICGDIHGQFNDIIEIMQSRDTYPSSRTKYIFNGDIVDRGDNSLECLLSLLIWKIALPNSLFITRGNHESEQMNSIMGLKDELITNYGDVIGLSLFDSINLVLRALPLAHSINGDILVMHGGLPLPNVQFPHLNWKERISISERRYEPLAEQFISQIMWNDPYRYKGEARYQDAYRMGSRIFKGQFTDSFMEENDISLIVRSHEWFKDGYAFHQDHRVMTIFSATDYLQGYRSKASIIVLSYCGDDVGGGDASMGSKKLTMESRGVYRVGKGLRLEIHSYENPFSLLTVDAADGCVDLDDLDDLDGISGSGDNGQSGSSSVGVIGGGSDNGSVGSSECVIGGATATASMCVCSNYCGVICCGIVTATGSDSDSDT